ncbi:hypothetical protein COU56_00445 [Candidatus Pacearchaeota archaeon CG10_big_fil_rev_8_21_14_0_10_31_9]|nr:MAG: hypothetical protein COU56_00445 [Candidatus Pacearchaeota archaeon CG10_big_fil_rev_8_21_14_0_10_31_9]
MKSKLIKQRRNVNLLIMGIIFLIVIFLGILVSSQDSGNSAQNELNNLEQDLVSGGYLWLGNNGGKF